MSNKNIKDGSIILDMRHGFEYSIATDRSGDSNMVTCRVIAFVNGEDRKVFAKDDIQYRELEVGIEDGKRVLIDRGCSVINIGVVPDFIQPRMQEVLEDLSKISA